MKTNVPFIFIHILYEEVTLTISFNSSNFVVYGDQGKISLHSVLAILTLALSVNYVGSEEHCDEDQNNYYCT